MADASPAYDVQAFAELVAQLRRGELGEAKPIPVDQLVPAAPEDVRTLPVPGDPLHDRSVALGEEAFRAGHVAAVDSVLLFERVGVMTGLVVLASFARVGNPCHERRGARHDLSSGGTSVTGMGLFDFLKKLLGEEPVRPARRPPAAPPQAPGTSWPPQATPQRRGPQPGGAPPVPAKPPGGGANV